MDKHKEKKEISIKQNIIQILKTIEEKTGIKGYIFVAFLVVSIILIYFNIYDAIITNLVGTVYPCFCTIRCIQIRGDEKIKWLTYWVVFATFSLVDLFSPLIMKFVPFYFLFKVIFLIWLFLPNSNGAHLVYHILVKRVFSTFESDIDFASENLKNITTELVVESSDTSAILKGIKTVKGLFKGSKIPFKKKEELNTNNTQIDSKKTN